MWEENDFNNYSNNKNIGIGQIYNDDFSTEITKCCSNVKNKYFLEIGTWNGLGSTKYFIDELTKRNDDYIFYSLECNSDKAQDAKELYKYTDSNKIKILNEVIWNKEPSNFYEIFPECLSNELYKKWNEVDLINMKKCNIFLERVNLPDIFDVILLDGGEFTTYHEFQLLKDRCKYLLLDDINVAKCMKIVEEIKNDPNKWKIIIENRNIRNGFMVCVNLYNI
jgi:hypothetical protein